MLWSKRSTLSDLSCHLYKATCREIEEENRIHERRPSSQMIHDSSDSSLQIARSDSSISVVESTNQSVNQLDFGPPGSKNVSIPIAGNTFENTGFQSTDDL